VSRRRKEDALAGDASSLGFAREHQAGDAAGVELVGFGLADAGAELAACLNGVDDDGVVAAPLEFEVQRHPVMACSFHAKGGHWAT
jgi:hypothetical protein